MTDRWSSSAVMPSGRASEHFKRWLAFETPLRFKGKVELRTKEIARLRIARLNECRY